MTTHTVMYIMLITILSVLTLFLYLPVNVCKVEPDHDTEREYATTPHYHTCHNLFMGGNESDTSDVVTFVITRLTGGLYLRSAHKYTFHTMA